jgi:CheY-like chemotaxis protein
VEIVDNGQKAVDCEAANPYDIIFMDVQMPVMDGVQACKLIHGRDSDSTHALASVVFVTAQVSVSFEAEYFHAGAYDFLPKPCNMNGVRNRLKKYVEAKKFLPSSLSSTADDSKSCATSDLVH